MAQPHGAVGAKAHHRAGHRHMAAGILAIGLVPPGVCIAEQLDPRSLAGIRHAFDIGQGVAIVAVFGARGHRHRLGHDAVRSKLDDQCERCGEAPASLLVDSWCGSRHAPILGESVLKRPIPIRLTRCKRFIGL